MKAKVLFLFLVLVVGRAGAQQPLIPTLPSAVDSVPSTEENLVYNPSFEEYTDCPKKIDAHGVLTIVQAWFQPTAGSADYYHTCGSNECGVPKNKLGVQYPHSGNAFCGIYCSKTNYREYLQTQLKAPLQGGETYELTFYVSLSEYSAGAVATIGGLLTADRLSDTGTYVLMRKETRAVSPSISQTISTYYRPQVQNDYFHVLTNTASWTRISGTFVAEGGEQFLTLGNFLPASQSNVTDLPTLTYLLPGAYYYVDDVSLRCLTCPPPQDSSEALPAPTQDSTLRPGATFVLENIYFDFDKSTLLQQSYVALQGLMDILSRYPKMKVEIGGHTDDRGSAEYNQRLSESRAHAVVDYLVANGIEARRLTYKGYGKSKPIDTNHTDSGRAHNRRVEVKILSM